MITEWLPKKCVYDLNQTFWESPAREPTSQPRAASPWPSMPERAWLRWSTPKPLPSERRDARPGGAPTPPGRVSHPVCAAGPPEPRLRQRRAFPGLCVVGAGARSPGKVHSIAIPLPKHPRYHPRPKCALWPLASTSGRGLSRPIRVREAREGRIGGDARLSRYSAIRRPKGNPSMTRAYSSSVHAALARALQLLRQPETSSDRRMRLGWHVYQGCRLSENSTGEKSLRVQRQKPSSGLPTNWVFLGEPLHAILAKIPLAKNGQTAVLAKIQQAKNR